MRLSYKKSFQWTTFPSLFSVKSLDRNEVLNHKRVAAAAGSKTANQFTAAKQKFQNRSPYL